jgi:hypothetical protein
VRAMIPSKTTRQKNRPESLEASPRETVGI